MDMVPPVSCATTCARCPVPYGETGRYWTLIVAICRHTPPVPPAAAVAAEVGGHPARSGALRGEVGAVGGEAHEGGVVRERVSVGIGLGAVTIVDEDVGVPPRRDGR